MSKICKKWCVKAHKQEHRVNLYLYENNDDNDNVLNFMINMNIYFTLNSVFHKNDRNC